MMYSSSSSTFLFSFFPSFLYPMPICSSLTRLLFHSVLSCPSSSAFKLQFPTFPTHSSLVNSYRVPSILEWAEDDRGREAAAEPADPSSWDDSSQNRNSGNKYDCLNVCLTRRWLVGSCVDSTHLIACFSFFNHFQRFR
jgi:hypothetical protein